MPFYLLFHDFTLGGNSDSSLVQIPSGSFHSLNLTSRPSKTLLFKDAALTIKRTTVPFNFHLIVTRVFEEGEEELLQEEEDSEFSFLIDEVLLFYVTDLCGDPVFKWFDPLEKKHFEYVVDSDSVSKTMVDTFEVVMYQSMFQRRSKKDHTSVSDAEFDAYVKFVKASAAGSNSSKAEFVGDIGGLVSSNSPKTPVVQQTPQKYPGVKKIIESVSTPQGTPQGHSPMPMSIVNTPVQNKESERNFLNQVPVGSPVVCVSADLYLYDHRASQFHIMRENITATIIKSDVYKFHLVISSESEPFISQPIDNSINPQFNSESHCFVWLWRQVQGNEDVCYPWSLKFDNFDHENSFREAFAACLYETNNESAFTKLKAEDRDYLVNSYQDDVEMRDADNDEEEEEEVDEESEDDESDCGNAPGDSNAKISHLTIGSRDRSFFVRGTSIGVLSHPNNDEMKYSTTINNVKSLDSTPFSPSSVLLHKSDTSMVMMRPGDDHKLYRMDLNVGKVVEEWKVSDIVPVTSIISDTKQGSGGAASSSVSNNGETMIGFNRNTLFRIDPRLPGNKLVDSESKTYVSNLGSFNAGATTGSGHLALGSSKGDIRLYDKLSVRAKTHLPGLGDPILGVDVTEDGKWLVATCKNYLLVICTEAPKGNYSGFKKSLGDQKPAPKRLQLRPEHVAWMSCPVNFTPARFNTGCDETSIVTSTGPFVITWNFKRIKQGKYNDYTIKQYGDKIVADNFKFGEDKNIIVALPDSVQMVAKKSLQTPMKMIQSRSSIVNSPF